MRYLTPKLNGTLVFLVLFTCAAASRLSAQIYVLNDSGDVISEYTSTGALTNAALVTNIDVPFDGNAMASDGSNLFVVSEGARNVSEYSSNGYVYTNSLASGNFYQGLTVSGSSLYVSAETSVEEFTLGSIPGTVTSSNTSLITNLANPGALAVSGSNLFVNDSGTARIAEYNVNGQLENSSLILTGGGPGSIAISGSELFTLNGYGIGEYTLGSTPGTITSSNPDLIKLPGTGPDFIAISGGHLYVEINDSIPFQYGSGTIEEYNLDGTLVNSTLISGLYNPTGLVVEAAAVPEPSYIIPLLLALALLIQQKICRAGN